MLTGRKYLLKLTDDQEAMCVEYGNICRAVWNTALDQRRQAVSRWIRGFDKPYCGYNLQAAQLTEAKREEEWLKVAPSEILQQVLMDLDRTCRTHRTFQVAWRSKSRWKPSFRFPKGNLIKTERINRRWGQAKLPKLGWVVFRMSRPLGGLIRSATVSYKSGQWYVSFLVEDGKTSPEHHDGEPVGVDRGVATAAVTSTGEFHDREFATPGEKVRHRRLQQQLARQEKGSANRRKTRSAMSRLTDRSVDRRGDFCNQTASHLTRKHSTVVLEDLRIGNITATAKGTGEKPGMQVRAKSALNRSICDKGWHLLERATRSAARYTGTRVEFVDPAYTSQTCNECQHVDPASRESQARFRCTACGHTDHADVNAAKNVCSAAGHAVPACGDFGFAQSSKQEPAAPQGVPRQRPPEAVGIPQP